jgi:hypothetical protein
MRNLVGAVFLIFGCFGASVVAAAEIKFNQVLAEEFCKEKWTKRGTINAKMFSYCMGQQNDGYAKALELYNKYSNVEPVELIDGVVTFALNKWANRKEYQLNMVAFEIEKQGEAYLNIAYEVSAGNLSAQKLATCKSKWITDAEPQWDMVEYCSNK